VPGRPDGANRAHGAYPDEDRVGARPDAVQVHDIHGPSRQRRAVANARRNQGDSSLGERRTIHPRGFLAPGSQEPHLHLMADASRCTESCTMEVSTPV
jgi:hypothetical protein